MGTDRGDMKISFYVDGKWNRDIDLELEDEDIISFSYDYASSGCGYSTEYTKGISVKDLFELLLNREKFVAEEARKVYTNEIETLKTKNVKQGEEIKVLQRERQRLQSDLDTLKKAIELVKIK